MTGNDRAPLQLATGDLWDAEHNPPTGSGCDPQHEPPERRRSRKYIERFRKRIPLGRAIRLMCGACMGGEVDEMPRGELAQAIDECGSCTCPRQSSPRSGGAGQKARRCLEGQRRTAAESATGHSAGAVSSSGSESA